MRRHLVVVKVEVINCEMNNLNIPETSFEQNFNKQTVHWGGVSPADTHKFFIVLHGCPGSLD